MTDVSVGALTTPCSREFVKFRPSTELNLKSF